MSASVTAPGRDRWTKRVSEEAEYREVFCIKKNKKVCAPCWLLVSCKERASKEKRRSDNAVTRNKWLYRFYDKRWRGEV